MQKLWRVLHNFIIINFFIEVIYGFYMIFYVVGGGKYPLMMKAEKTPIEVILKRRLFAIETWVAIAGLAGYLGITEVFPRKLEAILEKAEKVQAQ